MGTILTTVFLPEITGYIEIYKQELFQTHYGHIQMSAEMWHVVLETHLWRHTPHIKVFPTVTFQRRGLACPQEVLRLKKKQTKKCGAANIVAALAA